MYPQHNNKKMKKREDSANGGLENRRYYVEYVTLKRRTESFYHMESCIERCFITPDLEKQGEMVC
jgi:hypothetical protein